MYEVKLEIRATRQVRKLDPHIKEVVKRRVVVLFVGSRENFYKELQRYLG